MNRARMWNSFAVAARFLTIFPLGGAREREIDKRAVVFFFPTVGFLIGLLLYIAAKLLTPLFPPAVLACLLILFYLLITRMLHVDGLIDTFDGLLGGKDKAHALRIMKDPQAGSFGVIAAILLLLSLSACISHLIAAGTIARGGHGALVVAPCVGRWAMVFAASVSRPARPSGLGKWFLSLQSKENLLWASFLPLILLVGVFQWHGLLFFAAATAAAWLLKVWSERAVDGVTGDVLGAVAEISQLSVLLFAAARCF